MCISDFATLKADALDEVAKALRSLARFGLLADRDAETVTARVSVAPAQDMAAVLANAGIVFEGVPEVVDLSITPAGYLGSPTHSMPNASRCAKRSAMALLTFRSPIITPAKASNGCMVAARMTACLQFVATEIAETEARERTSVLHKIA